MPESIHTNGCKDASNRHVAKGKVKKKTVS